MIRKVLIIGNSVRNIACSAKKAGYIVYALDLFGDVDMQKCANKAQLLENTSELKQMVESFGDVDAIITGSGFETLDLKNTLNNTPKIAGEAGDKSKLPEKLDSLGIPHPETKPIDKADELGFPLMIKPVVGSGGMRNILVRNEAGMNHFKDYFDTHDFLAQEFIEGIPCSASLISTGDDAAVVALNEQLIGLPWLTGVPFAYCGNITPFHTKFKEEMMQYAEQIAVEFKLRGSNGVDFIVTDKGTQVIEINPRFQGSLDTVELSTGLNIFDAHVKSFEGELPEIRESRCFAAKAIIFAEKELMITKEISDILIKCMDKGGAADIPRQGLTIHPDEPVMTLLATSRTRMTVLDKIRQSCELIKRRTEV
ncbi:MAG: ATP-grasp domain-containing protein [Candidatus Methanoperedens sp.]|nr:ATP-grasp domain-containing protein [Candidatus Methanoperedens sp.]